MMPLSGIALIIIAVALCILVLVLIPTVLEIRRTAKSVGELAEMVQCELKPTLQELTGVLAELKIVGGGLAEHTGDVKHFMSALGEAGINLSMVNRSVGVVAGILNTTSVWATGTKVAAKYMFERYLKKRGGM
ncbi:MAG: DUF948 domain-containing protein [Desulfuromonadaceae bacterium]|nr:DUF948 domain-containing protein [Desulfuromonadaceae bacterium]